jgi:hypothetical protein
MILDVIVSAAGEMLGDLGPAIAVLVVERENLVVLVVRPLVFLYVWVQVIVPAFTALFSDATR